MQSAYDRNDYVTIQWDNILPRTKNNFNKYTSKEVTHFNTTYDYGSVMHYSAYGFSKNGEPTIVPRVSKFSLPKTELCLTSMLIQFLYYSSKFKDENFLGVIGQRKRLSEKDVFKLNAMYECSNTTNEQWTMNNEHVIIVCSF